MYIYFILTILVFLFAIFWVLEGVPLSNGTSGRGKHIRPVTQFGAGRLISEHNFSDRLRCTDTIVIHDGDDKLHFLKQTIKAKRAFRLILVKIWCDLQVLCKFQAFNINKSCVYWSTTTKHKVCCYIGLDQ